MLMKKIVDVEICWVVEELELLMEVLLSKAVRSISGWKPTTVSLHTAGLLREIVGIVISRQQLRSIAECLLVYANGNFAEPHIHFDVQHVNRTRRVSRDLT